MLDSSISNRLHRGLPGVLFASALVLLTGPAGAFCKATTCDAASSSCPTDANGCGTGGHPLSWTTGCISFAVSDAGSMKRNIDYDTFDAIVRKSLQQWLAVDCGGGAHPSIALWDAGDFSGPLECDTPEYNPTAPNANAWLLRDADWPYKDPGSHFAHTTVTYDSATGRILDADVELDSAGVELTTSDDTIVADLESIATHEAGHFLGLADSSVPDATMSAAYSPASREARSLAPDDIAGICALYPPARDVPACSDPSPSHGFSRYCADSGHDSGCALSRGGRPSGGPFAAVAAALLVLRRRRATLRKTP